MHMRCNGNIPGKINKLDLFSHGRCGVAVKDTCRLLVKMNNTVQGSNHENKGSVNEAVSERADGGLIQYEYCAGNTFKPRPILQSSYPGTHTGNAERCVYFIPLQHLEFRDESRSRLCFTRIAAWEEYINYRSEPMAE